MLALRLSAGLYRFRESLFLLPAIIVVLGAGLAEATAALDRALGPRTYVPFTLDMTGSSASATLSTLAGATITTAGVVFSLTVVSLQLASSQFSPRVMRSFIRDRLSQVVIGLLVATFVFSGLTLRHIESPEAPAPPVSLTVAVALTLVTVLLIVAHLDHLARGLQVGEVVHSIGAEGASVVDAMLETSREEESTADVVTPAGPGFAVPALRDGWVTQAPSQRMLDAVPPGTTIRLDTRTGAYIHAGEASILRVLRMLIAHLEGIGRPQQVEHLRNQLQLALESVETAATLLPADRARLLAIGSDDTDPADHGRSRSRCHR